MNTIKLCDIKISDDFTKTKPSKAKIEKALNFIDKFNRIDKPIILKDGVLIDGYARYLAATIKGFKEVPYMELRDMNYIVGKFNNGKKEFIWKNNKGINIKIGDKVFVRVKNKNGISKIVYVIVVNMFKSDNIDLYKKHKSVIKKVNK